MNGREFATVSASSAFDFPDDARGIGLVDWDHDGRVDLGVSNRNEPRLRILRNTTETSHHWLALRLIGDGRRTNRDAVGARVVVTYEGPNGTQHTTVDSVRAGEGFLAQSTKWLHFGLGPAQRVLNVHVKWPGAEGESFGPIDFDQRYHLHQGGRVDLPQVSRHGRPLDPSPLPKPRSFQSARTPLRTRLLMPTIRYLDAAGKTFEHRFSRQKPTLVNLWASWCSPCVKELRDLVGCGSSLSSVLELLPLSVDGLGPDRRSAEEVARFAESIGLASPIGMVDETSMQLLQELHDQFFFLRRPLPLPTSFLVDPSGRLAVIYKGPVSAAVLLEDVARLSKGDFSFAARGTGMSIDHPRIATVHLRSDLQTRYRAAMWLRSLGEVDDALNHLHDLARLQPQWALPHRHLAKLEYERSQLPLARRYAERALELDSHSASAHVTKGLIESKLGNLGIAEHHFRAAVALEPELAGAHNNLGIVLALQRKGDDAIEHFRRAVRFDPTLVDAYINLANACAISGKHDLAERYYQQAIERAPRHAEPHLNLGVMYAKAGNLSRAEHHLREALRLDPANVKAQRHLQQVVDASVRLGDPK